MVSGISVGFRLIPILVLIWLLIIGKYTDTAIEMVAELDRILEVSAHLMMAIIKCAFY